MRSVPASEPPADPAEELTAIYRSEASYVHATLARLGVRPRDLADVTHDVFVTVHRKLGDYDRSRPIRPWLFGFAFRHAAQYLRLGRNARELITEPTDVADESALPADEQLAAAQDRALVDTALATLDLDRRAALIMHDFDQHSVAEIAAVMDVPIKTVYSRLRTARAEFVAAVRRLQLRRGER